MKIGIPKEVHPKERRVAASPETAKKLIGMGFEVLVQKDAGHPSMMLDKAYEEVGARIVPDAATVYGDADAICKVQRPHTIELLNVDEMALLRPGQMLMAKLDALFNRELVKDLAQRKVTSFALELIPRITRGQVMDILSSQSNLAGYKMVIEAANHFGRLFPMMMTAAGTVPPAKVLVMGAGVAGLQAIATAKRLGAQVFAYDVRPAVKEEVQSLGAKFLEVVSEETKTAQTGGGYAREMSEDYQKKQAELIHENIKKMDIVITTALIPGRRAPVLVTEEMVNDMKPGSVIVDLAAEAGGNCPLCEMDKVVVVHDVTILSWENVASLIPVDASALYAKNIFNFLSNMYDKDGKTLKINLEDEIVKGTLVTHEGQIMHEALKS
ncbi:MAG: Re/Si-specific NAD(P)(+) transhydrogenase subunit alpha [Pseudomonadota bacterium]